MKIAALFPQHRPTNCYSFPALFKNFIKHKAETQSICAAAEKIFKALDFDGKNDIVSLAEFNHFIEDIRNRANNNNININDGITANDLRV